MAIAVAAALGILVLTLRYGERVSRLLGGLSNEVLMLTLFGLMLVVGGAAEQIQVSAAVGAFLVGIAVSGPVADRARVLVTPLRDLFAATFFVFFGLNIESHSLGPAAGAAWGEPDTGT